MLLSGLVRRLYRRFIIAALAVASPAQASDNDADFLARCGGVFDLCGYVQRSTQRELIPQRFERAMPFSDGLAAVMIKGLFGYVDTSGKVIITPQFDLAGPFSHGLAEVLIGEHAGVIDRSGKLVLPARYGRAIPLTKDVVILQDGIYQSQYVFDKEHLNDGMRGTYLTEPAGLFKIGEGWLTKQQYWFRHFSADGSLIWASPNRFRGPYGMLRANGSWQSSQMFDDVQSLVGGRAIVTRKDDTGKTLWGAVDENGSLVIPPQFEYLSYWSDGYAVGRKAGKEAFIDMRGQPLGRRFFDAVLRGDDIGWVNLDKRWFPLHADGSLGTALASKPDQSGHYIARTSGKHRIGQKNTSCSSGATIFHQDGLWGIKGPDGVVIIPAQYPAIDCFRKGVAWTADPKRKAWCPIGPDGEPRLKPDCEEEYYPFAVSHHYPEKYDNDRFLSSVLWMQAFLQYGRDTTKTPPRLLGDGVQGGGAIEVKCRNFC